MVPEKKKTSYPKDKINILFLENISDVAVHQFSNEGYINVKKFSKALSEEELIIAIKDVHLLGIRSKTVVTQKVLLAAEKLQAIGCFCIGVNQVDLQSATERGVVVFNAPYSNTRSVAELVIGASIILIRKILDKNKSAHEGKWDKEVSGAHEIRGKTLGIIGYGNIGKQVSVLAEGLGMKVIFYDTEKKLPLGNAREEKNLKTLVRKSDIITLHVPESESTKNLMNSQLLASFKEDSILINYSRGSVVDLDALAKALEQGKLGGAAIDVFPWEPEKNGDHFSTPLQRLNNVLLTPHIGGSTQEAQNNVGEDVSNKLFNYLEKGISTGSHTIPELALPPLVGTHRILHIHKNVRGVMAAVNGLLSRNKINIIEQYLKKNEKVGYVVLDVDKKLSAQAVQLLKEVKHTIKTRLLY